MPDIVIAIAGHRVEFVRTERFLLAGIGMDRRAGISGTIHRTGWKGWSVEVAVGSYALVINYEGRSYSPAA